ncbi:MAG: dihydrolipoyl dehydrogenase, partial [Pseudomonadota bacterium]
MSRFDLIVIGAGPGGYVAAIRAAQLGLEVAVVEREHLGGICLNWGCIPTKAMLRSAEVLHMMHRAEEFGLTAEAVGIDLDAVVARSRKIAGQLSAGVGHLLRKNKVTVLEGDAALNGRGQVRVTAHDGDARDMEAPAIILATGARARDLPGIEADGIKVWSYKHALRPPHRPKKLLIIGSGAIGIEFASFYTALEAKVTIVELKDRILPAEDAEISAHAAARFAAQGMTLLTGAQVTGLTRDSEEVTVTIDTADGPRTDRFDTVISAIGIIGNTEGLGLEDAGIQIDRGHVVTDRQGRTAAPGIWAIGDLTGPPWLAHKASHEGVMVAEAIAGQTPHPVEPEAIAGCTYCTPQIASIGLTEEQAVSRGYHLRVGRFPFIGNGKALALGDSEGLVKTIFDAQTGALLGAHMIGAEVTELIQGFVLAKGLETTEAELIQTVFPHPTLSEMMHESTLAAFGR